MYSGPISTFPVIVNVIELVVTLFVHLLNSYPSLDLAVNVISVPYGYESEGVSVSTYSLLVIVKLHGILSYVYVNVDTSSPSFASIFNCFNSGSINPVSDNIPGVTVVSVAPVKFCVTVLKLPFNSL